ncbi:MAG TPA: 4-(cytidine 5'-diphospho)-2-C-methyl-D-erythritol kinase [Chiayiivirga sp.]|nr:4-(cytidine 5'-diphospho)-2-C-methyl-D-erythritol kinase [Chiayiivirga sp.]
MYELPSPRDTDGWSQWPAPAKINLFLHIIGRRPDGYHHLQTVFQLLDWGDWVRLRVRKDGAIVRDRGAAGVPAEADLAVRAAKALRGATGCALGAEIDIDKRIPQGGGFGGGSSDAASVLVGLNHLWELGLGADDLATIGLGLGADVPVFVRGRSAFAEGVGDCLTPITLAPQWYLLVDPGVGVPTAELFAAPDLTRDAPPTTIADFLSGSVSGNAFEPVLRARSSEAKMAMDWLAGFGRPQLTGTGSGVFLAFGAQAEAQVVLERLPRQWRGWVAQGVDESALHRSLRLRGVQGDTAGK